MARTKSPETDEYLDESKQSRIDYVHGGEKVFAISPDDVVEISNPSECEHIFEKDETEEIGEAFVCKKCGIISIFNKR